MRKMSAGECRAMAQDHLDKIIHSWTCTLSAKNRDKVLADLRRLILVHLQKQKGGNDAKSKSMDSDKGVGKLAGQLQRFKPKV
jgi:hypothetical protein